MCSQDPTIAAHLMIRTTGAATPTEAARKSDRKGIRIQEAHTATPAATTEAVAQTEAGDIVRTKAEVSVRTVAETGPLAMRSRITLVSLDYSRAVTQSKPTNLKARHRAISKAMLRQ